MFWNQEMIYTQLKRFLDVTISVTVLILLSPILLITAIAIRIKLGSPILFSQIRPGKIDNITQNEQLFRMYKFRTMSNERNDQGQLLPDEDRLTDFGIFLRKTSIDELPELWNVIIGDMSLIGPRPLLVRDMVFMTSQQRNRHRVKPGITGLAQINGRNEIDWLKKLELDLKYVNNISLKSDISILLKTILSVTKQEGITEKGKATASDFGDYLLENGKISITEYEKSMNCAEEILRNINEK